MPKDSTLHLYSNVLKKINYSTSSTDELLNTINKLPSISYKLLAFRAVYNECDSFPFREEYKELLNSKSDTIIKLPMTLDELLNIQVICTNELRQVVEAFTVWLVVNKPLRLDYYNVPIYYECNKESCNYMTYKDDILTFYLNDFKNVKSFGPQIITYSDVIVSSYIKYMCNHFNGMPEYLLYRYDVPTGTLMPFSSRAMFSGYLKDLFKRHTGHAMSMNTIRKIHESALIQSPEYSKMTTTEKKREHGKLLHSLQTAHDSYNIIM
jgi:hypothetical protein